MLRRSACGMNRKVFCGALWVHPIEGTKLARKAAAAAHRNVCVKEIMRSLFGVLFSRTYAIGGKNDNAKAGPQIPSQAGGGGGKMRAEQAWPAKTISLTCRRFCCSTSTAGESCRRSRRPG